MRSTAVPAAAPDGGKGPPIGFLYGTNPAGAAPVLEIFRQALSELGYEEGRNLAIEYRWGEGSDARLAEPAAELARLPVDAFVVPSISVARSAREASTTVPIILAGTGDPVAAGLAASLAHPWEPHGGNEPGVAIVRQAALHPQGGDPVHLARGRILGRGSDYPVPRGSMGPRCAGRRRAPSPHGAARPPEEFDDAFETAAREGADALLPAPSPLASAHRPQIIQLAARLRWPAMYYQRQFVDEGGLMAYDASLTETWRRAAVYVDKILKGANPADLPIEQPMRFDFTVNLATAEALGLTFPEATRLQVTEVIR